MRFPFDAELREIQDDPDPFIDSVFGCLESEFLVLPKGPGFVEYPDFEAGYQALKMATAAFSDLSSEGVFQAVEQLPITFVVLRTMLGFTPPEWAYVAAQRTGIEVPQGAVRTLDRNVRMHPLTAMELRGLTAKRLRALVDTACRLLEEGPGQVEPTEIHRLGKADTLGGKGSLRSISSLGVPYAMVLYERLLGRPFAGHRDSVSDLVGGGLESAIEDVLAAAGVGYRKTRRAEKIPGFEQAPDFIVPDEYNPRAVIEAKITEDDGTARDKVARIQQLDNLSRASSTSGKPEYEVIACIAGRGFGHRRSDMKRLLLATRGKVFTLRTLGRLVDCTSLRAYRTIRQE